MEARLVRRMARLDSPVTSAAEVSSRPAVEQALGASTAARGLGQSAATCPPEPQLKHRLGTVGAAGRAASLAALASNRSFLAKEQAEQRDGLYHPASAKTSCSSAEKMNATAHSAHTTVQSAPVLAALLGAAPVLLSEKRDRLAAGGGAALDERVRAEQALGGGQGAAGHARQPIAEPCGSASRACASPPPQAAYRLGLRAHGWGGEKGELLLEDSEASGLFVRERRRDRQQLCQLDLLLRLQQQRSHGIHACLRATSSRALALRALCCAHVPSYLTAD
eukprot:CAMPEP_0179854878 /NCGR_PEP_ID=MMETSP0982-20121206/10201_1 /TAXON_ID=483367 /ORGANISM="non described non described, Strain CCMP 2436" /LENGTH=278 /DNA_ID=CAMNT_0021740859 /DNA_START=319 /DNA_END=1158 /DNA_ORIENTATION=-